MTGEGNPRTTIGELRTQLMELAASVTGYAPPPKPDRFERDRTDALGPIWNVPQSPPAGRDHVAVQVRVIDGESGVFVEGAEFSYGGDWHAFTTFEARAFGMALLAAADWSDGQDVLGQRRAQLKSAT